jgi:dATP pyrophosphohydrolase
VGQQDRGIEPAGTPGSRALLARRGRGGYLAAVTSIVCTQVEVHLFRRRGKRLELMLLRRSSHRSLAGVWQPVTGGIERGETILAAAAREVLEETGLTPLRWWALEHLATFYEPARDRIGVVPVFAAEVAWADPVSLSDEHDRYAFVPPTVARRRVLWATQRRAIAALLEEIVSGSAGGAAREVTSRLATTPSSPRRAARRARRPPSTPSAGRRPAPARRAPARGRSTRSASPRAKRARRRRRT